jgi:uncharacterized protein (UPF0276 family)
MHMDRLYPDPWPYAYAYGTYTDIYIYIYIYILVLYIYISTYIYVHTVPFQSIRQSHITGLPKSSKCHDIDHHSDFGKVTKPLVRILLAIGLKNHR